jgi:YVTN family beta-propeller protein
MRSRVLIGAASADGNGQLKPRRCPSRALNFVAAFMFLAAGQVQAAEPVFLELERKIPLGDVKGRIDHFAIDLNRHRLFVAELGNNSVGVIDLKERKLIGNIAGLEEPQGVAYVLSTDTLYVANAGNGSVHLFQGSDLAPSGVIELGDDADNIRVDTHTNRVFIGYGRGALAVIDPSRRAKLADVPLAAHPEGFQIHGSGTQIFVNLPDVRQIAVVDSRGGKVSATWAMNDARANFPMAIDEDERRVLVAFRSPAKLLAFAIRDSSSVVKVDSCADADDVFVDSKRHRIYVSCGEGFIDVFQWRSGGFDRVGHIPTESGARTSLLVPELDRLFLAVRATPSEQAAVWVFRPTP